MTTEEKLARFSQDAIMLATRKHDEELAEYENNLSALYDSHAQSMKRQAQARIKLTEESLLREKNRRLSKDRLKSKHLISQTETELKDRLYDQVLSMLLSYRKTDSYIKDLKDLIAEAGSQLKGRLTIYLDKGDEHLLQELTVPANMELKITTEDIAGGILAMTESSNVLLDLSYRSSLNEIFDNMQLGGDI